MPPAPQPNRRGAERRNEYPWARAGAVNRVGHAVDERRARKQTGALDLHVDESLGTAGVERFGQRSHAATATQGHLAKRGEGKRGEAFRSPRQPRQIVIVKNHDLAGSATLDVQLHAVRAVGHGTAEGGNRVFGLVRARTSVGDDQWPFSNFRLPGCPRRRIPGHGA